MKPRWERFEFYMCPGNHIHLTWCTSISARPSASRQGIDTVTYFPLRLRRNGRHFADGIFKCIFMNENVSIANKISLKFVPTGPINNIPALVQIMTWRRLGNKPLQEPMMVNLQTHICVTPAQWVYSPRPNDIYASVNQPSLVQIMAWNPNQNLYIFLQEKTFENAVWEIVSILCRSQCGELFSG